jgi:uncharacterized protein YbjT (DUF2867 family)
MKHMSDKPILVTGATGSVSSLVIPQLLAGGSKVRALVHSVDKGESAF